jgi:membrane fusion protein (multidrug efflux system)
MKTRDSYIRGAVLAAAVLSLAACGGAGDEANDDGRPSEVVVSPENVLVVQVSDLRAGPPLSGTLAAERESTVRAELAGSVLQVYADKGQRVAAGAPLARIEDRAVQDALLSAQSGVRSARQALDVAERNADRTRRLQQAGAVADRDLESANLQVTTARGQLADAQARLASAAQQASNATARAPISGVVSDRPVNAGDVVQPGAALFTIVDPASMRLEAAVPAVRVGEVKVGAPVRFTVAGYPGRVFTGTVSRINPAADPATRQVPVTVSIPNAEGALVAGLFAEGTVEAQVRQALLVPIAAVDERGVTPAVMRLKGGKAESVPVTLGVRDGDTDRVEVTGGLQAGDTILVGGALGTSPGSRVVVRAAGAAPAAPKP